MKASRTQLVSGKGPWPKWIESDEGKRAADISTLPRVGGTVFLENRLWRAFVAGMNAEAETGFLRARRSSR